jgi:beta-mannosidase
VASWSSIDYFGRWKALHYYARRFYNDILVSPTVQNDTIKVFVISDRLKPENAILTIQYIDFSDNKKPVLTVTKTISINPQSSTAFYSIQKEEWARFIDPASVYLYCKLTQRNAVISENRLFFNPMKDCRLPVPNLKIYTKYNTNGFEITVSTDELARNIYLSTDQYDGFFTDNFFDLNPGQSMTIQFKTAEKITLEEFRKTLTVQSLVDAFGEYKRK